MKSAHHAIAAILLCAILILGGCITTPFTHENKPGHTDSAAETVPVDRVSETYMDIQEGQLRKSLDQTGVNVTRKGENIHLNMPGHLTFASGSYKIKPGFHNVLDSVAALLKEYKDTHINICGHTDSIGKADYNQTLSKKRAQSVARYLAARGVSSQRFSVEGLGETQPIASNKSKDGRTKNRRVEIEISPSR